MALVINTNIGSLNAQRNLASSRAHIESIDAAVVVRSPY